MSKEFILFDAEGHPYRFDSEESIASHRLDARTYAGLADHPQSAPSDITPPPVADALRQLRDDEVEGRHLSPEDEFYHTDWQWGVLEFFGKNGLQGAHLCFHAHFSPTDARANFDPSLDMIPVDPGDGSVDEDFAILTV